MDRARKHSLPPPTTYCCWNRNSSIPNAEQTVAVEGAVVQQQRLADCPTATVSHHLFLLSLQRHRHRHWWCSVMQSCYCQCRTTLFSIEQKNEQNIFHAFIKKIRKRKKKFISSCAQRWSFFISFLLSQQTFLIFAPRFHMPTSWRRRKKKKKNRKRINERKKKRKRHATAAVGCMQHLVFM